MSVTVEPSVAVGYHSYIVIRYRSGDYRAHLREEQVREIRDALNERLGEPSTLADEVRKLREQIEKASADASPETPSAPESEPEQDVRAVLEEACSQSFRPDAAFTYRDEAGTETRRDVEPREIVENGGEPLLVAWDYDRDDYRTFRLDRIVGEVEII